MESKVRQWIAQEQSKYKQRDVYDEHDIFLCAMSGLGSFLNPKQDTGSNAMTQPSGLDIYRHYGGDATLFELGCYFFVCIDVWLFSEREKIRNAVSQYFIKTFIDLFSESLCSDDIYKIFAQRIDKYGELFRNSEKLEVLVFHLTELIMRTEDDSIPNDYQFSCCEPITLKLESELVRGYLLMWMKHTFPATLATLEVCFNNYVPSHR